MPRLVDHRYGKSRVQLSRLDRSSEPHRLAQLSIDITLEGAFEASYLDGDNGAVVPTDTMKNTVYALAREAPVDTIEAFARRLARHFLASYRQVRRAEVAIEEQPWAAITVDGRPASDAFRRAGPERPTTRVVAGDGSAAGSERVESGIRALEVVKTARSGFSGFPRDRFTTLADTEDRLFATVVDARWRFRDGDVSFADARAAITASLLASFAEHDSRSVQETLYAMATAALEACPDIDRIRLRLPNRHHLLVDLEPFGLDNPNLVFMPTSEPYGDIEATVDRR